jgi:LacI family transcriptional regulator
MQDQKLKVRAKRRDAPQQPAAARSVTIKDLAAELELSITTISRALNGYSDVGEETRKRIANAAREMGYRPNRNAQRLVTRKTHNLGWVQSDNDRKFVDPHFVEVMAGVLRGARAVNYDVVLTSDTPDRELAAYDRYVNDNSVDGFIVDLPREGDERISYLLERGRPFVVHGRESRAGKYGWVDIDNYGNFYQLTRLLLANGHRRIAFINGDEDYTYAIYRRQGALAAVEDAKLKPGTVRIYNSLHPMGDAGFKLTSLALEDPKVTAILYSSTLMAVEGHAAIARAGGRDVTVATMDDELHYLDLSPYAGLWTFVRSSLREAGQSLIDELIRQCEKGGPGRGTLVQSTFHVVPGLDESTLARPLPAHRR